VRACLVIPRSLVKALVCSTFLLLPRLANADSEWLTWGHDPERTGANPDEKVLNKDNVSQLEVKWIAQISTAPKDYILSTMTAPLVAMVKTPQGPAARVFVVGSDNSVFAIDAATGKVVWQKANPNTMKEPKQGDYRCPNSQNATPVIDKETGTLYVSTNDGKLRGFSLLDGADRMPPTNFTDPFARNWSLNLIDGVIYSPTARGCLNMQSHFTALDLKDPVRHPLEYYTNTGITSGAWGRGGLVRGSKGILGQTADGSTRIFLDLREAGETCSKHRVARIMRANKIRALHGYRTRRCVAAKPSAIVPDLVKRNFDVIRPNKVWVTDITYIRTWQGWLYLAVVMDLFSRMIVGWSAGPTLRRELVLDAVMMAVRRRRRARGTVIHSDQGCQYGSDDWRRFCRTNRLEPSMSRRGNCWDNAVAESFFASLKKERIKKRIYNNRDQAIAELSDYIDSFYNPVRRHRHLGGVSPEQFEASTKRA